MKFVLILAMLFSPCLAFADVADAEHGVKYTQEQVVTLPDDHEKWYVSVMGDPADSNFQEIREWFSSHDGLKAVRDATHFNVISSNTEMFQHRYARSTPQLPCVRVQRRDGSIVFESRGDSLPLSADALHAQCFRCLRRHQYHYHMHATPSTPQPQPSPRPAPDQDPLPQPLTPAQPYEPSSPPLWLLGMLAATGAVVGVAYQWRLTHKTRG